MLADVVNAGTAYRARQAGFMLPAAGKTGTTNNYVDAWFVGFTPHLVTGVWIGFDQPATIIANGYAGELAVPIWANFMKTATKADKPDWFERPPNVVTASVCRVSGKLPNGGCESVEVVNRDGFTEKRSMIYTEYFVKGTQPTELCPLHPSPSFMDRIAGLFGGGDSSKPVPPEEAGLPRGQAGTSGAHQPPAQVPDIHHEEPPKDTQNVDEPPKKRGFWARVFGKDGKKQESKKKGGGG
jgi:penicillin-binding protein 1A